MGEAFRQDRSDHHVSLSEISAAQILLYTSTLGRVLILSTGSVNCTIKLFLIKKAVLSETSVAAIYVSLEAEVGKVM